MTRAEKARMKREEIIGGQTFLTVWGICEKIPGRTNGTNVSFKQMCRYVEEGCPCFEHSGKILFEKDLTAFMEWLRGRKPMRQIKAQDRIRRLYGR